MRFTSAVTETVIIFLTAYLAFEVTEVIEYSGITATLACGLTLNYFAMHNLSKASQEFTQQTVKVAASIADTLIFFQVGEMVASNEYVGENVFLNESLKDIPWKMVLSVFVIIIISRTIVVTTITYPINLKRTRSKITPSSQMMMIYASMRGSMSYSLALSFPSHNQAIATR